VFTAGAEDGLLFFCKRTSLLPFQFGNGLIDFVFPLVAEPLLEHQRKDVVFVILTGRLASENIGGTPQVVFQLSLSQFHDAFLVILSINRSLPITVTRCCWKRPGARLCLYQDTPIPTPRDSAHIDHWCTSTDSSPPAS
jgi:hypothetical protein